MADDEKWTRLMMPRFRLGNIVARHEANARRGPGYQFYHLVPPDIMEVTVTLGIAEYTREAVDAAAASNLNRCIDLLAAEKVDYLILGGAPVSAQLGRERALKLMADTKERTGIPMTGPIEAMLAGLKRLGTKSIAIGSRWADELNQAMAAYFTAGGIEVLGVTTRGQWNAEAHKMTFEEGLAVALDVGREAARMAPQADAIIVPGGAAMSLHVIPALEDEFGKPALTNMNAEVWQCLVEPGVIEPVKGWGTLLANR
jgi:maleate isomerase